MNRKIFWLLSFICFVLFAVMLFLSNQFDWDHFLTVLEVEYRSWIFDHRPPLWTYQACAGSSRIGDPLSFGLSPLILFVLIFGSFWGAKILALFCTLVGYVSLTWLLRILIPLEKNSLMHSGLSLFFVLSGYFLWHFHVGHLTFALTLFALLPIYLSINMAINGVSRQNAIFLIASTFTYLSGGLYPSLVVFIFPLICACGFILVAYAFFKNETKWKLIKNSLSVGGLLIIALLLSSYKWLNVMQYQHQFPRDLTRNSASESPIDFFDAARFYLSPTWDYQFVPHFSMSNSYSIWEYSAFSAISWLLLMMIGFALLRRKSIQFQTQESRFPAISIFILSFIPFLFLLGDDSPFSLHYLLNEYLYQHSVRVVGRYLILLGIPIILLILFLSKALSSEQRKIERLILPIGFLMTIGNILSFLAPIDTKSFLSLVKGSYVKQTEMRVGEFIQDRIVGSYPFEDVMIPGESFMYPSILQGRLVANCYQPLRRYRRIADENWLAPNLEKKFSVVYRSPNDDCSKSIYLTQNEIHFDRKLCDGKICLNLNMINPMEDLPWNWDDLERRYCLTP